MLALCKNLDRRGVRLVTSSPGRLLVLEKLLSLGHRGYFLGLTTSSLPSSGSVLIVALVAALFLRCAEQHSSPPFSVPPSSPTAFSPRTLLGPFISGKASLRETLPFFKLAWNLFCCSLARQFSCNAAAKRLFPVEWLLAPATDLAAFKNVLLILELILRRPFCLIRNRRSSRMAKSVWIPMSVFVLPFSAGEGCHSKPCGYRDDILVIFSLTSRGYHTSIESWTFGLRLASSRSYTPFQPGSHSIHFGLSGKVNP